MLSPSAICCGDCAPPVFGAAAAGFAAGLGAAADFPAVSVLALLSAGAGAGAVIPVSVGAGAASFAGGEPVMPVVSDRPARSPPPQAATAQSSPSGSVQRQSAVAFMGPPRKWYRGR